MRVTAAQEKISLASILAFYRAPFAEPIFRRWMVFSALFATAQFFAGPFYMVYALQILKMDYFWIQILGALSSLSGMVSMPMWGYLSDKFGNRPLLGIAAFGVGLLPLGWVFTSREHMTWTLLILAVNHLAGGLFWGGVGLTQFNTMIEIAPAERKSVYIGAMSAVTGLAGGLAPIIGGAILTSLGSAEWRIPGWTLGSYQIIFLINAGMRYLALLTLRLVPDTGTTRARDVLTQLGTANVGVWKEIRRLQRAPTERERQKAARSLRSARHSLAVEELIVALDDPSLHVREEAAEALGDIGDPRAVHALIAHLDDPASGIVDEAASALGRIGDPRAVEPLAGVLQNGEKSDRIAAARALGRIKSSAAVPALLVIVESGDRENSAEVVEACVRALGAIREPGAAPALIRCLQHASRSLRMAAVRALGNIGHQDACGPLLQLLKEEDDPSLILYTAVALAMIDARDAVLPLLDALDRVESEVARKQILNAVGALMGEEDTLYPLLGMEHFSRDEAVSRIIREMGRRGAGDSGETFGARRRSRQWARVLEHYMASEFNPAFDLLSRLCSNGDTRAETDPVCQVLEWAKKTAPHRNLRQEEFLLALLAARRLSASVEE